jgi:hypothetical protein
MNKEFVPYEQALELKELGFDEPCFKFWFLEKGKENFELINSATTGAFFGVQFKAPLYQQTFRWFREKYNLYAAIYPIKQHWECDVRHTNKDVNSSMFTWDNNFTYEEAELACLNKLIQIVKNK